MSDLLSHLPSGDLILVAAPTLIFAYLVFGLAGFGSALVAAPIIAHVMPVADVVPLFALTDCTAVAVTGIKLGKKVAKHELLRLVPLMAIGNLIGIYLILTIPPKPMMIFLGIFVFAYAIYALVKPTFTGHLGSAWVIPFGTLGGVFSAMFGAGGFIYAIYLSRRLEDTTALRGTLTAVLGISNITRLGFFMAAGVYNDGRLPILALCALPVVVGGLFIGYKLAGKLNREQFIKVLCLILIVAGVSLIARATFG
ncbi:MAG: sulfite exporter TauE/SafE family protein [Pseudolabrys sp.]